MIEFAEETYGQVIDEIRPLFDGHWQEIALDKEHIKLDPDYEAYQLMARMNMLHITTVRDQGRLVGYCVCVIRPHLHYRQSLTAINDIFYIHPDYRQGMTGVKMFKAVEKFLNKRGVQRVVMNTKLHQDVGLIFERLGYRETERIFTKLIG